VTGMKKYLVAFSVIHRKGQFMSRAFIEYDRPVSQETVLSWETVRLHDEYVRDYGKPLIIRVTSFQALDEMRRTAGEL
jgi:hypothetical protein